MAGIPVAVQEAISELMVDDIQPIVQKCLEEGVEPWEIITAMSQGMVIVGERFEAGDYYLAELVLSGEIMKEGMAVLGDRFDPDRAAEKGTVILATAKGDIHDIGKNIVGTMLAANGFKVIDLGVDCPAERILEALDKQGTNMIALSVLLTTMVGAIKDLVDTLEESGLRDKVRIAIGGACCSQQLADEMRVDAFGSDAVKAVRIFEGFAEELKPS